MGIEAAAREGYRRRGGGERKEEEENVGIEDRDSAKGRERAQRGQGIDDRKENESEMTGGGIRKELRASGSTNPNKLRGRGHGIQGV